MLKTSRLALDEEGKIVGAALLGGRDAGPTLALLMVRPGFRRRGTANTLVAEVVEELRSQGETVLRSAYCVSNEESAPWHRAFGFKEEPELNLARLRRMFYAHETSRHAGLETAEARREHARLEALRELWSRRTEELEDLARREGFEAMMPALRYRPCSPAARPAHEQDRVPCRRLSGLFDESGLDEVPVEREGRGAPALCHDDEGDAIRQRVTLVLTLLEVVETLSEQVFINVYQANRRAV